MNMRYLLCIVMLAVIAPCCGAADLPFELHEWGVFPVPRNAAWAMLDTRAELAEMPEFFCMMWPKEKLPWHGPVTKPVIYFYPEHAMELSLKIKFADGRPLVWWPAASHPVGGFGDAPLNELHFNLRLGDVAPPGSWQRKRLDEIAKRDKEPSPWEMRGLKDTPLPEVPTGHWIEALRAVPATKVFSSGGHSNAGYQGDQVDMFVYYDGLMKAPATPQVARDGAALVVKSNFPYAISDLMVIDRNAKQTRIGKAFLNVAAGEQTTRVELVSAGEGKGDAKTIAALTEDFVQHLTAAGLTKEESVALEKVWHDGLFLHEGLNLFYRVPQETYDAWLPLEAKPKPTKLVRVGIVVHQHLEPELEANVAALIKNLSAEEFEKRQNALQSLMTIGGAAFPILEAAIKNKDTDLETANGCRKVIETLDARPGLESKKRW